MSKCCVVEPRCIDYMYIRYVGDKEEMKVWFKDWHGCDEDATVERTEYVKIKTDAGEVDDALVFHTCAKHAKKE